jgi:hypothetical protein
MRLSAYAKQMGVSYKTAFRWWKAGKLDAYQLDTGTVIVREPLASEAATNVALYARVSSADQKEDLERQMQRLKDYAASRGYQVTKIVSELASGLNESRPKFLKLLTDASIGVIVVEHREVPPLLTLLANSLGCVVEPFKSRNPGRSNWIAVEPSNQTNQIDSCSNTEMLQMCFWQSQIPRATQVKGAHSL